MDSSGPWEHPHLKSDPQGPLHRGGTRSAGRACAGLSQDRGDPRVRRGVGTHQHVQGPRSCACRSVSKLSCLAGHRVSAFIDGSPTLLPQALLPPRPPTPLLSHSASASTVRFSQFLFLAPLSHVRVHLEAVGCRYLGTRGPPSKSWQETLPFSTMRM